MTKDTTRSVMGKLWKVALVALLAAAPMTACGDDEAEGSEAAAKVRAEAAERAKQAAAAKAAKASQGPQGMVPVTYAPKHWELIKRYFEQYRKQASVASRNVFAPNAAAFIERPKVPEPETQPTEPEATAAPVVDPPDVPGLEAYDLKEYELVMIVSGTTVNRALVLDPKGKQYFVERGARIGNKGARVKSITQYTVFVQEPDSDKPVKLDIEPPFIGLESSNEGEETPSSTVVPKTDLDTLFKGLPAPTAPATPRGPQPAPGRR